MSGEQILKICETAAGKWWNLVELVSITHGGMGQMQITDIKIRMLNNAEGKTKAWCSIVFDGAFAVHDLRVVEGANGVFVAMPSRKTGEGQYRDVAHPVTAEARERIQKAILKAYNNIINQESVIA